MKVNPFKPGSIVGPGVFAGRFPELKAIDQALYQTKNGSPSHFLIHGERGIGKSSLLFVTEAVAGLGIIPKHGGGWRGVAERATAGYAMRRLGLPRQGASGRNLG